MNKQRCIWTNRESEQVKEVKLLSLDRLGRNPSEKSFYVLPEHEQELREFNDSFIRYSHLFLKLVLGITVLMTVFSLILVPFVLSDFISESVIVLMAGAGTMLIGCTILVLPFSTPETVGMLGLKKSILIARIAGAAVILIGAGFIWFYYM